MFHKIRPRFAVQILQTALALAVVGLGSKSAVAQSDDCNQEQREAGLHFHIHPLQPFISTGPVGYSPVQIKHAYGIDKITGTGAGQIIAVVEAYGSSTI